ncbi:deoxycytidylate deaminase, partial [Vibrio parahaemolyticus]
KFKAIADKGYNHSYCFKSEYNAIKRDKNQVHTRSLHAEENAFLQISKDGGSGVNRGFLFTTASPCELCAKKAYQLGMTKIFYIDPYPGISMDHILRSGAEKQRPEMVLFNGAIGRAFHNLYTPIAPYKDELSALIP